MPQHTGPQSTTLHPQTQEVFIKTKLVKPLHGCIYLARRPGQVLPEQEVQPVVARRGAHLIGHNESWATASRLRCIELEFPKDEYTWCNLCIRFLYLCKKKVFKRVLHFLPFFTNMVKLVIQSYPWESCISSKKAFEEVLNLVPFVLILLYLVIEPYAWDSYTFDKKMFFRRYCICFHLSYYSYVTLCMRFL